ncbi:MAG: class I SAM-dependent methyltransferase [Pseudomonadales bacterium]
MNGRTDQNGPSLEALVESGVVMLASLHPGGLTLTTELARACGITTGTRVLDVACGAGESTCFLAAESGARVTGLDRSETLLERGRIKAAERGLDISFRHGDAQAMPFEDATFDVVICECTLSLLDKATTLAGMARVVRPGGCVGMHDLFWQPDAPEALRRRLARYEHEAPESLDGWRNLFVDAGLVDVHVEDHSAVKERWMRETRSQIGLLGQLRIGTYALRRWGFAGLWRILASQRLFSDRRLGYALVTGNRP